MEPDRALDDSLGSSSPASNLRDKIFTKSHAIASFGAAIASFTTAAGAEPFEVLFYFTYLFLFTSVVLAAGLWSISEFVTSKNPTTWDRPSRRRATDFDKRRFFYWKWIPTVLIMLGFVPLAYIAHSIQTQIQLSHSHGRLYPSNEPTPVNMCGGSIKEDSFVIFLGDSIAVTQSLPATVLNVNGQDVLSVDKNRADGTMAISLTVRTKDETVLAQIQNGEFTINKDNALIMERSNWSSLKVEDKYGKSMLAVKYLNPKAMWIDATLENVRLSGSNTPVNAGCIANPRGEPMLKAEVSPKELHIWSNVFFPKVNP